MKGISLKSIAATMILALSGLSAPPASIARGTSVIYPAQQENGNRESNAHFVLDYLERISGTEMKGASIAVFAVTPQGDTIVDFNSSSLLIPASNMKLITTGLALHHLGGDFTYETRIGYSGSITDGVLNGDLYLIGGGDPTLAAEDSIALPYPQLFKQWTRLIKEAGITRIEGDVIGDGRYFGCMPEQQTWQWDDCGTYYGSGISGLTFFRNIQTFQAVAGERPGDPVTVTPGWPECPWMHYTYDCTTGAAGTGDKLYYYTSDLAPAGEMRGTFAVDRSARKEECSNKFPEYTCAYYFTDYLRNEGIGCNGSPADLKLFLPESAIAEQDSLTILGSTLSPSLARIAFETNHESDNLYAETLFNTLGKTKTGHAGYEMSAATALQLLSDWGCHEKITIKDGSGLSRQDLLTPSFICHFLELMKESPAFGDYLNSLPSPGSNGTMTTVMTGYDPSLTGRIRLKSGSMTGVKCFSGYIFPEDGGDPGVFSIMMNNSLLSQYRMQKISDRIIFLITAGL